MRYIDGDALLETLKNDYDLEDTLEYRVVLKEIENAPTVARTWNEWWRMRLRAQGHSIDYRFKDRPLAKEQYKNRMEIIGGCVLLWAVISVLAFIKLIEVWQK